MHRGSEAGAGDRRAHGAHVGGGRRLHVVAIADSDSYLKWAAGLLATLPAAWCRRVVVVSSPIAPSAAQRAAALTGLSGIAGGRHVAAVDGVPGAPRLGGQPTLTGDPRPVDHEDSCAPDVRERTLPHLLWELRREQPDVVVLACTGPVVQVLADALHRRGNERPVLVSGLPGLCLPANERAWRSRARVDLLVTHSRRERRSFAALAARLDASGEVALGRLPFLDLVHRIDLHRRDHLRLDRLHPADLHPHEGHLPVNVHELEQAHRPDQGHGLDDMFPTPHSARVHAASALRTCSQTPPACTSPRTAGAPLVFAAQAKVPASAADRRAILLALDRLARQRPDLRPVVKLRALAGERQTHREDLPYDVLWRDLVDAGRVREGALEFAVGPMAEQLVGAAGLATVSSTAALEAIAAGVPVLVLGSFGVDARMLNSAFAGSGLIGHLDDLAWGRVRHPDPDWLGENYFHDPDECDLVTAIERLTAQRTEQGLPARPSLAGGPGPRRQRRNRWRLLVPRSLVPVARQVGQLEATARRVVRRSIPRRPRSA